MVGSRRSQTGRSLCGHVDDEERSSPKRRRLNPNHPFAGTQTNGQNRRVRNPFLTVVQRSTYGRPPKQSTKPQAFHESADKSSTEAPNFQKAADNYSTKTPDASALHIVTPPVDTDNESDWSESSTDELCKDDEQLTTVLVGNTTNTMDDELQQTLEEEEEADESQDHGPFLQITTALLRKLQRRQTKFVSWESLLSTVSYAGRKNMTALQYEYLRQVVTAANSHLSFRTYKTMRTTFWADLKKVSFPSIQLRYLGHKLHQRNHRKTIRTSNAGMRSVSDCAAIVFPSEWAKLDVVNYHFYRDVYESDEVHRPVSIERSPIVQHRSRTTNEEITLWATYKNAVCPTETGDTLSFPCIQPPEGNCASALSPVWNVRTAAAVNSFGQRTTVTYVNGKVWKHWMVNRLSCAPKPLPGSWGCSDQEKDVYETLSLTSPIRPRVSNITPCTNDVRRQTTIPNLTYMDGLFLHAGDTCTFIRPCDGTCCHEVCLLVTSMLAQIEEGVTERLVWVETNVVDDDRSKKYVKILAMATVSGIPSWVAGVRHLPTFTRPAGCNSGTLANGKRFVVYRIVLYTDGFGQLKSISDQREVGGVYILPVGLPSESKRSWSGARVISLTPDGHSMNKILKAIENDLVVGASTGIEGVDPYGRPVQIFLDTVGYFGDYPAVTSTTDVRGHNATAFCTFCTFREVQNAPGGSRMYSTSIHSRRLGLMRWDSRREVVRGRIPHGTLERRLGFSRFTESEANELPLVSLAMALRKAIRAKTTDGRPVVPYGFDSIQSTAAAPDHLLCGIIDDVLELCFANLPTEQEQLNTEAMICSNAKRNGLDTQGRFLKWKGNKPDGLRSLTMSTKTCILLAAAHTFRQQYQKSGKSLFLLPHKLQQVVAAVYNSPSIETEGEEAKDAYSEEGLLKASGRRTLCAKVFIHACAQEHKSNPAGCKVLNKPNNHRLLELCCNTVDKFGHGLNCSEMVLESMHRRFKNWLETNPHPDSHISAVEKALSADWMGRVSILYRMMKHGNDVERTCAGFGLRRLLLGKESIRINTSTQPGQVIKQKFEQSLDATMKQPVLGELDLCMPLMSKAGRTYSWVVEERDDNAIEEEELLQGRTLLERWNTVNGRSDAGNMYWFKKARYVWASKCGGWKRSYQHHTITRGTAVSIVVGPDDHDRPVIKQSPDGNGGTVQFYAVYGIMCSSEVGAWCVVKQLRKQGEGYTLARSSVSIMQLGDRVRRVAVFHQCDNDCVVHAGRLKVRHSATLLRGGIYRIARRVDGYPPHLG